MASMHDVESIETDAAKILIQEIGEPNTSDKEHALQLTGLEPIIAWIATKVALPIVTGLVGRALYDKWKDVRTRSQAGQIREELTAVTAPYSDAVDPNVLLSNAVSALKEEGIAEDQARRAAMRILQRCQQRYGGARPAG